MTEPKTYPTKVKHVQAMRWDGTKESTESLLKWIGENTDNKIEIKEHHLADHFLMLRQKATLVGWHHSYVMPGTWVALVSRGHVPWFKVMTDRVFRNHYEVDGI